MHLQPGREEGLNKCPSQLPPPTNKRRASPGAQPLSWVPHALPTAPALSSLAAQGHSRSPSPRKPSWNKPPGYLTLFRTVWGRGCPGQTDTPPPCQPPAPGAVPTGCPCSVALASQWNQRRASCPDHRVPKNRRQLPGPAKIYRLFTFQQLLLWVINVT